MYYEDLLARTKTPLCCGGSHSRFANATMVPSRERRFPLNCWAGTPRTSAASPPTARTPCNPQPPIWTTSSTPCSAASLSHFSASSTSVSRSATSSPTTPNGRSQTSPVDASGVNRRSTQRPRISLTPAAPRSPTLTEEATALYARILELGDRDQKSSSERMLPGLAPETIAERHGVRAAASWTQPRLGR